MGIFSKLRDKISSLHKSEVIEKSGVGVDERQEVPDIGLLQLIDADWRFFGGRLMINGVLPANFIQKPCDVKVGLALNNKPYAEVTYKDKRTDERKTFKLYQNTAKILNNSTWESNNGSLELVWEEFRKYLQSIAVINRQRDIEYHQMAERAYNESCENPILPLDIYEFFKKEEEFLKKYQGIEFDLFGTHNDVACFAGCEIDAEGKAQYFHLAKPFSPRTLEFCVSNLTKEAKCKELENEDAFKMKCVEVAINSPFMSQNWERLTDALCMALQKQMRKGQKGDIKEDKQTSQFVSEKG